MNFKFLIALMTLLALSANALQLSNHRFNQKLTQKERGQVQLIGVQQHLSLAHPSLHKLRQIQLNQIKNKAR